MCRLLVLVALTMFLMMHFDGHLNGLDTYFGWTRDHGILVGYLLATRGQGVEIVRTR